MSTGEIDKLKSVLRLESHPEGGNFKEVWRADRKVKYDNDSRPDKAYDLGSSIYFLLEKPNFVSWHRHPSDAIYVWNAGSALIIHTIDKDGNHKKQKLGDCLKSDDCQYQVIVPHDIWYACELDGDGEYCLFCDIVLTGWTAEDWMAGTKDGLKRDFPQHTDLFERLCKT